MERIFLVGYMGAGKTTFGKPLSERKDLQFIDLDHYIESRYQKTIGQLFEEKGELVFREIEFSVLKEVSGCENIVISTGGGTPCFFDAMGYMNKLGTTIYLKSSPKILLQRLSKCGNLRPLLSNKNESELLEFITENLEKREMYYNRADIIFNTDKFSDQSDVERLVENLIDELNSYAK